MIDFWHDIDAIKDEIKRVEDDIVRWKIRSKLGYSGRECEAMMDALYSEIIDLCIRRDELDDAMNAK